MQHLVLAGQTFGQERQVVRRRRFVAQSAGVIVGRLVWEPKISFPLLQDDTA